ncbi:MAG: hypothetical protein GXY44_04865 [Phycisphaerales bacterium]|nr:hypothetical protein [Phycisphaerales bacterium]
MTRGTILVYRGLAGAIVLLLASQAWAQPEERPGPAGHEAAEIDRLLDEEAADDRDWDDDRPFPPGRGGERRGEGPPDGRPGRGAGLRGGRGPDSVSDGRPGFGRGEPRPEPLTTEETEALMDFMKERFPDRYEQLNAIREANPTAFRRMIFRHSRPLLHILRVNRHDPEMAEVMIAEHRVESELIEKRQAYREARGEAARQELIGQTRKLLDESFDLKQKRLEMEIERLRKRLDEQARRVQERKNNKGKIIEVEILRLKGILEGEGLP